MSQKTDLFIPDQVSAPEAQARTSHLGIGAHQDDLEFMAFHGIATCYEQEGAWFSGITCTDGAGSARSGAFADKTDEAMKAIRQEEQRRAAEIGQYSFMAQLGFFSASLEEADAQEQLVDQLVQLISFSQPEVIYTHNPIDRHPRHVAVFQAVLAALQRIPPLLAPEKSVWL
jgi:LmbE family N-acetylglucosaminyl deacetylase